MGAVFEVEDRETGRRLALKTMLTVSGSRLLRFKREFRAVSALRHPNLVHLNELGCEDELWFFTMELIEGQDLATLLLGHHAADELSETLTQTDLLLQEPLSAADVSGGEEADAPVRRPPACDLEALRGVLAQVLDALEYLHAHGVVHRDLKPSNILVDTDGEVRVLDFGLASRYRPGEKHGDGAIVGTLAYMAPEQCRGALCTPAADRYALGCLLFTLLAGHPPLSGPHAEVMRRRLTEGPPRLDSIVEGLPAELVSVCAALMDRDPEARPEIDAIRDALGVDRLRRGGVPGTDAATERFVGRYQELATLTAALERAAGGEVAALVISGESGIGKSALARALVRWARPRGFLCLAGKCYEREHIPYLALDRAMDELLVTLQDWPPDRLEAVRPHLHRLRPIFPVVEMYFDAGAEASLDRPLKARAELAEAAFVDLLDQCQREGPLLLVLDDMQWTDAASLELVSALVRRGAGRVALLLLTRPEGTEPGHPLEPVLALAHAHVSLTGLGLADAAQLVTQLFGASVDEHAARQLARQTGGHPFLLSRVAEYLLATTAGSDADAPVSVDGLLWSVIATLSDEAEEVFALAATAGREVRVDHLQGLAGLEFEAFDAALAELESLHFIRPAFVREEVVWVDVYHDRIRELMYDRMPEHRRRSLHRRFALLLEAEGGASAGLLFTHWSAAKDEARRVRYAQEAALEAEERLAFERAAQLWMLTLSESPSSPAEGLRWLQVGDLFDSAGNPLAAADAYERALTALDAQDMPRRVWIHSQLGKIHAMEGRLVRAREAFAAGLSHFGLPLERGLFARISTLFSLQARLWSLGLLPDDCCRRAPRPTDDARTGMLQSVLYGLVFVWWLPAVESALRTELETRRIDSTEMRIRSVVTGVARSAAGRRVSGRTIEVCRARLSDAERRAQEVGSVEGLVHTYMNQAVLWLYAEPNRARHSIRRVLGLLEANGARHNFHGVRAFRLLVLADQYSGRYKAGLEQIRVREQTISHLGFLERAENLASRGWMCCLLGLLEEAEAALGKLDTMLLDVPRNRMHAWANLLRWQIWLARGEGGRILAEPRAVLYPPGPWGTNLLPNELALPRGLLLEAVLVSMRRGQRLPRAWDRKLRRWSRQEQGHFAPFRQAAGWRVTALRAHLRGRSKEAQRRARRALDASRLADHPHIRWLCLHAAVEVGAATGEHHDERRALQSEHGYVMWPDG